MTRSQASRGGYELPSATVPTPPEQQSSTTSVLGPAFLLFFCCGPSPFGTLTSGVHRHESWTFVLPVVGIELGLLTAIVWLFVRLVRQPATAPTWTNAVALLVLGLLQASNGMTRLVGGAPPLEERHGTPDWGYRIDGAVFVVLGVVAAGLFVREVAHLRSRQRDPAGSTGTAP